MSTEPVQVYIHGTEYIHGTYILSLTIMKTYRMSKLYRIDPSVHLGRITFFSEYVLVANIVAISYIPQLVTPLFYTFLAIYSALVDSLYSNSTSMHNAPLTDVEM